LRSLRIVKRRMPQAVRNRYLYRNTNIVWYLAVIYEDILYTYAADMESYSDPHTLEGRVTDAARANDDIITRILSGSS
jgi:hypothetical protein